MKRTIFILGNTKGLKKVAMLSFTALGIVAGATGYQHIAQTSMTTVYAASDKYEKANVAFKGEGKGEVSSSRAKEEKQSSSSSYYDTDGNEIKYLLIKGLFTDDPTIIYDREMASQYYSYEYKFDTNGRMVERTKQPLKDEHHDGEFETVTDKYSYNSKGQLEKTIDIVGTVTNVITYEYDDDGNTTKECYDDGSYVAYEYDKHGNMIKEPYVNTNGVVEPSDDYEYDKDGNMIKQIRYTGAYWLYSYEDGRKVSASWIDEWGNEEETIEYEYDEHGNFVKWIAHMGLEGDAEAEYTYMSIEEYMKGK